MKRILLIIAMGIGCMMSLTVSAQSLTITGTVKDKKTGDALSDATVTVAGTFGSITDASGAFTVNTENLSPPFDIIISYLGYADHKESVTLLVSSTIDMGEILMEASFLQGNEVVVTGSRVAETVQQSPVSIQKINTLSIRSTASGDFYEGLANLKGVDIVTSSLGFRAFNTRGFNSTSPVRVVQFIDGVDNQAPGLNFPVGNLVGATDIDLQSIEIITGPASALYGPNAFQGVVSMATKNPFDFQGLTVQLKGGNRNLMDGQFRYAKAIGKNKKLAFKLSGSYSSVKDFEASDEITNRYGDFTTNQDLSAIVQGQVNGPDSVKYTNLLAYLDFNKQAYPGKIDITTPGYMEKDLTDYNTKSVKLGGEVAYKLKDSLQVSLSYKYGNGTAVYQGTNRYSINNITFHQQKLELTGKNFNLRAYNSIENAGDSYDLVFTALNLSKKGVENYVKNYLTTYFDTLLYHARGGTTDPSVSPGEAKDWMIERAHSAAVAQAGTNAWLKPGTEAFTNQYNAIVTNANLSKGAKFTDASSLQHVEGQYNIPLKSKSINWITGGNFRRYNPQSYGTIFRDTLINRADTLENGAADLSAAFVPLSVWEIGAYTQASAKFLKDKLNLIASVRADKNQNFLPQLSPRASLVFKQNYHIFRVSAQSAFRTPTLQNQFILLTLGQVPIIRNDEFVNFRLEGNLLGHTNLYELESAKDFVQLYDSTYEYNDALLKTLTIPKLRPEQVRTIEVGYRTSFENKLFIDAVGYFNNYKNFIGEKRVISPTSKGAVAGEESGSDALITGNYEMLQIPINSTQTVTSYGAALGLAYYFGKGIAGNLNYTYSGIDSSKIVKDGIIPGFNTPAHKISVGISGNKVWKGFGFNINYRHQNKFYWQSTFANGWIPAYGTLDAQLNYAFEKLHSVLRIGGSNLLNNRYRTAFGSPLLGRMGYVSWTFEFDKW
ncbi:MAG: TonB-dependent receptor [Bacteroidia bacterium]|nr:TonB-dependent receptor [Bacteroidia bacterium]